MAWDDLNPDQTIRPNGTLVDLTPETYVWLESEKRPGDTPLTGRARTKAEAMSSRIGTVIGHRKHYRCGAMWVVHQVFDGTQVLLVDLDQVWRDDGIGHGEPTVSCPITHAKDSMLLATSKSGLYKYVGYIEHMDTFPRRWTFQASVKMCANSNEHSFMTEDRWLGDREGFYYHQHDGIHKTAYGKALADMHRFKEMVHEKFDVER